MHDLKTVLKNKYTVISVSGDHAGEPTSEIFKRKREDITRIGKTFWLNKSNKAKPNVVQSLCRQSKAEKSDCPCIFIEPSTQGGSKPTKVDSIATQYSEDNRLWKDLPEGLGPVTGGLTGRGAYALIFNQLDLVDRIVHINLWDYADFSNLELPLITKIGQSTICAVKKDMSRQKERMKSPMRRIVAVGMLSEPYCVYVR